MRNRSFTDRSQVLSSIVRLDGHLADPALADKTASSTAFLLTHIDRSDAAWLITNAHCVRPELTHVNVLAYDTGFERGLGTIEIARFKILAEGEQDLAAALVTDPHLVARAFAWGIPDVGQNLLTGTNIRSYGYPNDGTKFSALRGPKFIEGVVQTDSIQYPTWGTNFHADGSWGRGRSGSPVFRIHDDDCILLGVNRGRADVKLPNGTWKATGWTRVISVDHVATLIRSDASLVGAIYARY